MRPDLETLLARLLTLGGSRLIGEPSWLALEFEAPFVAALLAAGRVFGADPTTSNAPLRLLAGAPGQCHENARRYAQQHPAAVWWTGLALSAADGAWRSHSWITTGQGALLETTEPRVLYFGLPAAFDPSLEEDFIQADRARLRRRFGLHL